MTKVELRRTKISWGADYPNDNELPLTTFLTLVLINGKPLEVFTDDTDMLEAVLQQIPEINMIRTGEW